MAATRSMILACTPNGGIGYQNTLPWRLRNDLKHFKEITSNSTGNYKNVIVMGRKTFESISSKPLPNRINAIISKTLKSSQLPQGVELYSNVQQMFDYYNNRPEKIFLIGGKHVFEEGIQQCNEVHLTRIGVDIKCDVHIDTKMFDQFQIIKTSQTMSENQINYDFQYLLKEGYCGDSGFQSNNDELQYLDIIKKCITDGVYKDDRTGVGTHSIFGQSMRFNLAESFPLLTTKQVFFRGVVEELLWFLRGETNGKTLLNKKIKIWEGNGSREYLNSIGLNDRKEHDLGPIYGFQWRHFGAKYVDCETDYSNQGIDQLKQVIYQLKNQPDSRRIILSAWNPQALSQMALPPCHVMAQFYVASGQLSCMMIQRSCDVGLGVPFNIASYALLTYILAKECNLGLGNFIHIMGDTHVYQNHVEALKQQIKRTPYPFPLLKIKNNKNIFDYQYEDFELIGYRAHQKIPMQMAV